MAQKVVSATPLLENALFQIRNKLEKLTSCSLKTIFTPPNRDRVQSFFTFKKLRIQAT